MLATYPRGLHWTNVSVLVCTSSGRSQTVQGLQLDRSDNKSVEIIVSSHRNPTCRLCSAVVVYPMKLRFKTRPVCMMAATHWLTTGLYYQVCCKGHPNVSVLASTAERFLRGSGVVPAWLICIEGGIREVPDGVKGK